jgi:hypothetical protein
MAICRTKIYCNFGTSSFLSPLEKLSYDLGWQGTWIFEQVLFMCRNVFSNFLPVKGVQGWSFVQIYAHWVKDWSPISNAYQLWLKCFCGMLVLAMLWREKWNMFGRIQPIHLITMILFYHRNVRMDRKLMNVDEKYSKRETLSASS